MKTGVELIAEERARQISKEGWTAEHDDDHYAGTLAVAAACYALPEEKRDKGVEYYGPHHDDRSGVCERPLLWMLWPWETKWWKPTPQKRVRELVKAGALIAAEIDRLQRGRL